MRYLLDADALIELLKDPDSVVARRARRESPSELAISAIVAHELFYGAFKSARVDRNLASIGALRFPVLSFDIEDARRAGQIRAFLVSKGASIGAYDVLIAGQALSRKMILVTHNTREFVRVPELRLEDWQLW
jgi:tRNA(fMet)-specific endonuclease VapC